ncbi:MAG TPA: hypothetical protein VER96_00230 [Polyangiaceae bacterium]|nr:hypothetical protein [Polyangiaceae bacterium]
MNIRNIASLLMLSCGGLACRATVVDLDSPIEASSEPGVLAIVHEQIRKLTADDQRLYWMGSLPVDGQTNAWFLRSCEKQNCAATVITYDAQPYVTNNGYAVVGDQIIWAYLGAARARVSSCPISGCVGAPHQVVTDFYYASAPAFDGSELYFLFPASGVSIYRTSAQRGDQQLVANDSATSPGSQNLAIHDAYAYWLTQNEYPAQVSLRRARKDGSSLVIETISDDVGFSNNHDFGTATDTTSIYWTNNVLAGSIRRCPLTGCDGSSELVLASLRTPQNLLLDGPELYYVHETKPYVYAVASCELSACMPSDPLFDHLTGPDVVALDDQYLYAATTEQEVGPSSAERITARIRRLPKPDRNSP